MGYEKKKRAGVAARHFPRKAEQTGPAIKPTAFAAEINFHRHASRLIAGPMRTQEEEPKPMPPPVMRKELLTAMIDADASVSRVEIQEITMGPGVKAPLHLHPCPTVGVISEGTISFQIEGRPVQRLKAGDAFYEPANVRVAKFDNDGDTLAKFVAFYLLGEDEHETVRVLAR